MNHMTLLDSVSPDGAGALGGSVPASRVKDSPGVTSQSAMPAPASMQTSWGMLRSRWMLVNVAFWTAVAFLYAFQTAVRQGSHGQPLYQIFIDELASFAPCALLTPLIAALALRYRFSDGPRRRAAVVHGLGLFTFVVVGGAMMGVFVWLMPWNRSALDLPSAAARAVPIFLATDVLIYVLIVAAVQAVSYARESRDRAVTAAQLQGQLAEARLHVLSAQLQPHFLFNTLHAISALVRDEPQQAERLLARLSDLLRHALQSGARVETTLGEELAFLEKYVDVQEARFGPRLQVSLQVDPRLLDARVPRLLLQPLVENSIRHGIARRPGPGRVEVSAAREGRYVRLTVADDGAGLPADGPIREGIGLSTTRARLRQLYGDDHQFALAAIPGGGTVCTIILPLRHFDGGAQ